MSEQQLVDAQSTMNATTFETDIYTPDCHLIFDFEHQI